jgi:hypothetical protein
MVTAQELRLLSVGDDVEITWEVTDDDLEHGEIEDCWKCPQARALNRHFAGMVAEVDPGEITLYEDLGDGERGEPMYRAVTNIEVRLFIDLVDNDDEDDPAVPGKFSAVFRQVEKVSIPITWEVVV